MVRRLLLAILTVCSLAQWRCSTREVERKADTGKLERSETMKNGSSEGHTKARYRVDYVDEGATNPEFSQFRSELVRAFSIGDKGTIVSSISEDFEAGNEFGRGIEGLNGFLENEGSELRKKAFLDAITSGGRFSIIESDTFFHAPFYAPFTRDVECNEEGEWCGIIASKDVSLHKAPDKSSPILATLSYDIVTVVDGVDCTYGVTPEDQLCSWKRVRTVKGSDGYVDGELVKYVYGMTVGFRKENGIWKISSILVGRN